MMMSMTCHNLEFGRTGLDLVACGCSSNASIHKYLVKNRSKGAFWSDKNGNGARKLFCFWRDIARCRVLSTKTPDFVNGVAPVPPPVLELKTTKEPNFTSEIV